MGLELLLGSEDSCEVSMKGEAVAICLHIF